MTPIFPMFHTVLAAVSTIDGAIVVVMLGVALFAVCMPGQRR